MIETSSDQGRRAAPTYPAEKVRQGDIVLRRRWQRIVFIAGLVGCGLVALFAPVFLR
jgi:hypothetical protein